MRQRLKTITLAAMGLVTLMLPKSVLAYSANKVWIEPLDDGRYRVAIQYTVPALKEFRLAHAIFTKRKDADIFYWQLIRGADFAVNGSNQIWFTPPKTQAAPW